MLNLSAEEEDSVGGRCSYIYKYVYKTKTISYEVEYKGRYVQGGQGLGAPATPKWGHTSGISVMTKKAKVGSEKAKGLFCEDKRGQVGDRRVYHWNLVFFLSTCFGHK